MGCPHDQPPFMIVCVGEMHEHVICKHGSNLKKHPEGVRICGMFFLILLGFLNFQIICPNAVDGKSRNHKILIIGKC
jgi:hypothetical protein